MLKWKKLKAVVKSINKGAGIVAASDAAHLSRKTLWMWRKNDPKLNELIQEALDNQVQIVEDALFRRAIGYRYEEETKEREVGTTEKKTAKIVVKEVAGDVTAQIFFLMNRAPERWADKRALINNININKNTVNNPISKLTDEALDGIINGAFQKR